MSPHTDPDLVIALARYNRAINAERRGLAARVSDVVRNNTSGRESLDQLAYLRISQEVDAIFSDFYGSWPNDPRARFLRLTLDQRRRAFAQPFARDAKDVTRRLKRVPAVLRALRAEAA